MCQGSCHLIRNKEVCTCVLQAEGLAQFLLRMLRFHPDSRATAEQLLNDPWLQGNLPEAPSELTDIASRKRRRPSAAAEDKAVPPAAQTPTATADAARAINDIPRSITSQQQPTTAQASGTTAQVSLVNLNSGIAVNSAISSHLTAGKADVVHFCAQDASRLIY